ncbi:unnamed protein product [Rotaria socialis]|uniref:Uncharacterized protein n=2 Tax=Rotaria socialis TaxID=392032 RepID=A0A821LD18_9BILA|nr:unnamed protein product [Rotaria socialis]
MLCSRDSAKYSIYGNQFSVKTEDHFYYVNTGNYESFMAKIKRQHYLLNERDEFGRTLLYIASRNGFHNICNFLLKSGCKINEVQNGGSTALHAAAFYGHQSIVELLLEYGANPEMKNKFGNKPTEEGCSQNIKLCIMSKTNDQIHSLFNSLKHQGLAEHLVIIKHSGRIIGKKILRNSGCEPQYSLSDTTKLWTVAWHGTKYKHLDSIVKYGLHPAGSVLSPGNRIFTQAGHIPLHVKVGSCENWANAIFVSPSIFYAADVVYSERIFSDNQRWCVLIETRVKPGSFSKHKQTLLHERELLPGEPADLEFRVAVKSDNDFILRVGSNRNVIVTAVLFVNLTFLENIDEYYQGEDLFADSEAERALFQ